MIKVYLAGKISKNDWRHNIIDVRGMYYGSCGDNGSDMFYPADLGGTAEPGRWPITGTVYDGVFCTGPYFVSCDHGCFHGENTHGVLDRYDTNTTSSFRTETVRLCQEAIQRSDHVFVWIDDDTCYGTLVEIGYAVGLGIPVTIASPKATSLDLWFAYHIAPSHIESDNPLSAFEDFVKFAREFDEFNKFCAMLDVVESPIEKNFFVAIHGKVDGIIPQYNILRYRVDFAIPDKKIAIELDGHDYHKTKEQRTNDAKRQRELELDGWRVIRFTGTEIHNDISYCVEQVICFVNM